MMNFLEERLFVYIIIIITIAMWYLIYISHSGLSLTLKIYTEVKTIIITAVLIGMLLFTYYYIQAV